jgi:hypothetical protein
MRRIILKNTTFFHSGVLDCSCGLVTELRAATVRFLGLIPGRLTDCFHLQNTQTGFGANPVSFTIRICPLGFRRLMPEPNSSTTFAHRLIMSGKLPVSPLCFVFNSDI